MTYDYDVIFIGSGHANWHAAVTLSQVGKKVAIVEKRCYCWYLYQLWL